MSILFKIISLSILCIIGFVIMYKSLLDQTISENRWDKGEKINLSLIDKFKLSIGFIICFMSIFYISNIILRTYFIN